MSDEDESPVKSIISLIIFIGIVGYNIWACDYNKEADRYNDAMAKAESFANKGDYKNALVHYKIAAEKGDETAQYDVGVCYARLENYTEAEKWYQKAADQGMEEAKEALVKLRLIKELESNFFKEFESAFDDLESSLD